MRRPGEDWERTGRGLDRAWEKDGRKSNITMPNIQLRIIKPAQKLLSFNVIPLEFI